MESPTNESRPVSTPGARVEVPAESSPHVRCILALDESSPKPPADLIEAFVVRHIEVRKCVGLLDAMTKLVIAHRDKGSAVALVVVEPEKFRAERVEELLRSAGKYAPRAARWVYDCAASPRLQKWVEPTPVDEFKVNGIRAAIRQAEGQPSLRLTGFVESTCDSDEIETPTPAIDEERSEIGASDALTEEELAMLLGPENLADDFGLAASPDDQTDDDPAAPAPTYEGLEP